MENKNIVEIDVPFCSCQFLLISNERSDVNLNNQNFFSVKYLLPVLNLLNNFY